MASFTFATHLVANLFAAMATYLSLEDAAKLLGIPTEKLIDLRSQGQVRGFRDGSSWKFPDTEIEKLKEELPNLSGLGSGILADDGGGSRPGTILGGDDSAMSIGDPLDGSGDDDGLSDIDLGMESPGSGGSDVNLVANDSGLESDVQVISGSSVGSDVSKKIGSDVPLDLDDVSISGSAVPQASGELEMSSGDDSDEFNLGGDLDLANPGELSLGDEGDVGSDLELDLGAGKGDSPAGNLELMSDMDLMGADNASSVGGIGKMSGDVLSELDLLSGESGGSGLLSGDSGSLLGDSLLGPDDGGSSGVDDALADDDLIIDDEDDGDLIVSGMGSDISIAGDSGINLMSPSDSGLSLESEPLDLAGSSISALDLGAELAEGTGSGAGSSGYGSGLVPAGSGVNFQGDDEFQLSPSGIQLDKSDESASQVIDVEDSGGVAVEYDDAGGFDDNVAFDEAGFDDGMAVEAGFDDGEAMDDGDGIAVDERPMSAASVGGIPTGYEIPFTLFQTIGLMLILLVMTLGGMLMTDLVRNMWSYAEPSAPVSSLTDWLIGVAGWGR